MQGKVAEEESGSVHLGEELFGLQRSGLIKKMLQPNIRIDEDRRGTSISFTSPFGPFVLQFYRRIFVGEVREAPQSPLSLRPVQTVFGLCSGM
jgi:hypothetical protein